MTHGTTPSPRHGFNLDLGDEALNARLNSGLEAVEDRLRAELSRVESFLTDKVMHLAAAGGKRFRPMMALLCAEFGPDPRSENVVRGATVVEVVHLATLYHDDVMDEAERRRGVESANARWTNTVAILAGDILFAHASRLMSAMDLDTVGHFADTFEKLVTGQMRETVGAQGGDPVEHYLTVIEEKTGVLISSAAYLGARHAGAEADVVDRCARIGDAVGMVFQIVDDIIDIFSDPEQSGKTPGTDLREGVFTLPVLYALEEDSPAGEELRGLLTGIALAASEQTTQQRGARQFQAEGDVVQHRQVREEIEGLEHHAHRTVLGGQVVDALVVDEQVTGGDVLEPGDQPQQRRLPAAARPQQNDELAGCHVERHVPQRLNGRAIHDKRLGDVAHLQPPLSLVRECRCPQLHGDVHCPAACGLPLASYSCQ